jgi:G2/mitotic-specific cyclin 2
MTKTVLQDITNIKSKNIVLTIRKTGQRKKLINWIYEVSTEFKYSSITYTRAVYVIDKYMRQTGKNYEKYQLTGISALFLVAKVEERKTYKISEYCAVTDFMYTVRDIVKMERIIVEAIDYEVSFMVPHHYVTEKELENLPFPQLNLKEKRDLFYIAIAIALEMDEMKGNIYDIFFKAKNLIGKMFDGSGNEKQLLFYADSNRDLIDILFNNTRKFIERI